MLRDKDLLIISHLRKNARLSITDISKSINVPVSTIFDRLRLREEDLIKKYTLLMDFGQVGFPFRENILLKVSSVDRERLKEFLQQDYHINSLYAIDNGFDFLIDAVFRSDEEMKQFLSTVERDFSLIRALPHRILEEFKEESFLSGKNIEPGSFIEAAQSDFLKRI